MVLVGDVFSKGKKILVSLRVGCSCWEDNEYKQFFLQEPFQ